MNKYRLVGVDACDVACSFTCNAECADDAVRSALAAGCYRLVSVDLWQAWGWARLEFFTPRGLQDIPDLKETQVEKPVYESVRLYRVSYKDGTRRVVEAQSAVAAIAGAAAAAAEPARVEVLIRETWVQLEGVL